LHRLAPALSFGAREGRGIGAVDRAAILVRELRHVHAPLRGVLLGPHDRAAAREAELARTLGGFHELGNRPPRLAGTRRVDVADPEHQRRIEERAMIVTLLERRTRPVREVAVARAVDKRARADGHATRPGLRE